MKPKRVIITRDADGKKVRIYARGLPIFFAEQTGEWTTGQDPLSTRHGYLSAERFKSIFGFLPKKGTKATYEVQEVSP